MKHMKKIFMSMAVCFVVALLASPLASEAAAAKLNKTSASVVVGNKVTLSVKNNKKKVTWSTDNAKVATVSKKGVVKGKKVGKATITAKIGKKKLTCKITVKSGLNKKKTTLYVGDYDKLSVTGIKGKVKWSVKNSKIATVKNGEIRAKKTGKTTITAKVGKKKYTCNVTVKNLITYGIKSAYTIKNGMSLDWIYATKGKVKVTSSDSSILFVENPDEYTFNLYGRKSGTVKLTISNTYDTDKKIVKITVKKPADSPYQRLIDDIINKGVYDSDVSVRCIRTDAKKTEIGEEYSFVYYDLSADKVAFGMINASEDMNTMEMASVEMTEKSQNGTVEFTVFRTSAEDSDEDDYENIDDLFADVRLVALVKTIKTAEYTGADIEFTTAMSVGENGDVQTYANNLFRSSMHEWEELLQSKLGIGLKDLGFTQWVDSL